MTPGPVDGWLRTVCQFPSPVVVLTASNDPTHEERSLGLGAKAFHRKPGDPEGLAEVIRVIVEQHLAGDPQARAFVDLGDYTRPSREKAAPTDRH